MHGTKQISIGGLSDERLVELLNEGNRDAFSMLFDRYNRQLLRFAYRYCEDIQQCEDIVQEVFLKLIERPEMFNSKRRFAPWIYTLTANACKNNIRNLSNRRRILENNIRFETETHLKGGAAFDNGIIKARIQEVYERLNEREQQMFVLRFEQELPMADIAEILSIPEGTVKSGIYYMLKKMSNQLKDLK